MNKFKIFNRSKALLYFTIMLIFLSCAHKSGPHGRDRNRPVDAENRKKIGGHAKVQMHEENGIFYVPIKVNGLDLKFIFDTGASVISLSAAEAAVMARQGVLTEDDVVGQSYLTDATGGVSVGTVVNLKTVEIGGVELTNVEATVVDNIEAPLLLGQTALSKFGKVTIDYDNKTIEFN